MLNKLVCFRCGELENHDEINNVCLTCGEHTVFTIGTLMDMVNDLYLKGYLKDYLREEEVWDDFIDVDDDYTYKEDWVSD